ncbi:hypothetical protein V757_10550 [Pelistega indica]|uniref:Uncharacterized protein n=1 Tax=Pelistega indica TaxID=1414851 RepID=V8FXF1_9BURK|nr:hypothetical protein [Pelistega indica]ETD68107.1 hypothetical protein V757_10550 [Pelistega indica]
MLIDITDATPEKLRATITQLLAHTNDLEESMRKLVAERNTLAEIVNRLMGGAFMADYKLRRKWMLTPAGIVDEGQFLPEIDDSITIHKIKGHPTARALRMANVMLPKIVTHVTPTYYPVYYGWEKYLTFKDVPEGAEVTMTEVKKHLPTQAAVLNDLLATLKPVRDKQKAIMKRREGGMFSIVD